MGDDAVIVVALALAYVLGVVAGIAISSVMHRRSLLGLIAESDRLAVEWMQLDRDVRQGMAARRKSDAT